MININNKEWDKLRFSDIQKHLSEDDDENFFFEYKNDEVKSKHLINEISAFANTYGGYIFLGIDDDKNISGCSTWNEQKINSTIHDSITPTPIFDIKKFKTPKGNIFIIKIEEGNEPPYITNHGGIYERVSSSSCVIKDSNKLTQLYNKRLDQIKRTHNKLRIDEPDISSRPQNLCAVLDVGFSVSWSNTNKIIERFNKTDINEVSDWIKESRFGVSRVGFSYVVSAGILQSTLPNNALFPANLHQFIEIMGDGSVKFRIPFYSIPDSDEADITMLCYIPIKFKELYSLFFGNDIHKNFICAHRYESLSVYKQFIPFYNQKDERLNKVLPNHLQKFGSNIIITSNRIPKNDFEIIERRSFNMWKITYNEENLLKELFSSKHINLGYIDLV